MRFTFFSRTTSLARAITTILAALLLLLPGISSAGSGKQALQRFFNDVRSLKADFVQTVESEDFRKSEKSSGKLMMSRPGHFRWDYNKPYLQQIIADGKQLWIFDIDLDQVIVKSMKKALGNTPAVLLSGTADLSDQFTINDYSAEKQSADASLDWVELRPKDEDAGFQFVRLGFNTDLRQMVLLDAFGQQTRIQFSELQRNPAIDPKMFEFTPPPGVDVLSE